MISIITAVYNQLAINRLYYQYLKRYTSCPFELIIIDNGSTDGSVEFFRSVGATVIENGANYSYPHSQNQGIAVAKYDVLAFLNNDIIVSPDWDQRLLDSMKANDLDIVTVCGIEEVETPAATKRLKRRWKRVKNLCNALIRHSVKYRVMHRWMYRDWERFIAQRYQRFHLQTKLGFVGNTVVMTRRALDLLGVFDERIQAADFDLCMRAFQRSQSHGDIKPMHIALDVFVHHFIRITLKSKPPRFVDADQLISFAEKWGCEGIPVEAKAL